MSDIFIRTTTPEAGNPYYTVTQYGGLNECIQGARQPWPGSALRNCVGGCWGAAYEALGKRPNLSRGNAEDWWGYTRDGYRRDQVPSIGSVACWKSGRTSYGKDGAGHVGWVIAVTEDTFTTWNSGTFASQDSYLETWTIGKCDYKNHEFQGFIHVYEGEAPVQQLSVDGDWARATTFWSQIIMGTEADGEISGQPDSVLEYHFACNAKSWKYVPTKKFRYGSDLIRAMQELVGADVDGSAGPGFITALERFLKAKGLYDGEIEADVSKNPALGPKVVKGWQTYVNMQLKERGIKV